MDLIDIVGRKDNPEPWSEGDNIPWHEPGFSARMLREHLTQEHNRASRRTHIIDAQVAWIHDRLLDGEPTRILDLGCGPGLYANRLARLGHNCTGIDYSPASIDYARQTAQSEKVACNFHLADVRHADYGADSSYGQAMLLFGELNVFRPADARLILSRIRAALAPGGLLLLEPHTFDAVQALGEAKLSWQSSRGGLFSERPHLYLTESFWNPASATATIRYFIVDSETGDVIRHAQSMQAYNEDDYRALLNEYGFDAVEFLAGLCDDSALARKGLIGITARKQ